MMRMAGTIGDGYQLAGLWNVPVASVRVVGSWLAARLDGCADTFVE